MRAVCLRICSEKDVYLITYRLPYLSSTSKSTKFFAVTKYQGTTTPYTAQSKVYSSLEQNALPATASLKFKDPPICDVCFTVVLTKAPRHYYGVHWRSLETMVDGTAEAEDVEEEVTVSDTASTLDMSGAASDTWSRR